MPNSSKFAGSPHIKRIMETTTHVPKDKKVRIDNKTSKVRDSVAKKPHDPFSEIEPELVGIMTSAGYVTEHDTAPVVSDEEPREFQARDQIALNTNEYKRSLEPASKVAGAAVYTGECGKKFAIQYTPPVTDPIDGSQWRPITNIGIESKFGEDFLRAQTPGGTEMMGKRSTKICVYANGTAKDYEWWRLSPVPMGKAPFYGTRKRHIPRWEKDNAATKKLDAKAKVKAQRWKVASRQDILTREGIKTRNPDQGRVMGQKYHLPSYSAHKAGNDFLDGYHDDTRQQSNDEYQIEIHPDRVKVLKANQDAGSQHYGNSFKVLKRFEWGHGRGFGLSSMEQDPQTEENLAAMPKWLNSLMLVCERTAKWIRLHRHQAEVVGIFKFTMVPDSDLLDHGVLIFEITEAGRKVVLKQDLIPWQIYPSFPRSSDIWQTTHMTCELLLGREPSNIQQVGAYLAPNTAELAKAAGTVFFSNSAKTTTNQATTDEATRSVFMETLLSLMSVFGATGPDAKLHEPDSIYKAQAPARLVL